MIVVGGKGDFSKTLLYFKKVSRAIDTHVFDTYGKEGVTALQIATPIDTSFTSKSWKYKIERQNTQIKIVFYNENIQDNISIAILLQYGHATKNGGWVEGRNYINPAIQPIFDKIAKNAWTEVTKL